MYNQHAADQLELSESPVEYLRVCRDSTSLRAAFVCVYVCIPTYVFVQRKFDSDYQLTRKTLGRYGLPGHAHTIKIKDLSGGQKARVVFAELALMEPDILILVSSYYW